MPDFRPNRREIFHATAALGIGSVTFQRALAVVMESAQPASGITVEMVKNAEWIAGVSLTDAQRKTVARHLSNLYRKIGAVHKISIGNDVPPALHFIPNPGEATLPRAARLKPRLDPLRPVFGPPVIVDDLSFHTMSRLSVLLRQKKISSTELTQLYLARLKKYDPALKCVVTLTEDLALKQARQADTEIAAGKHRSALHGIPWGAKDLIAYPGYRTTWGAELYKNRVLNVKAAVAERLDQAGAVLVAKTSLGTLALGDTWFGGMTRNPWNVQQGSSGSSAGSASSVAAGLLGFAIGSETNGSIISPCTRCGATGLRPTFGRISRHGCMTLSWSMDKLGPIARSVEDCALIFAAIQGADAHDASTQDRPFEWPCRKPLREIRVGYEKREANTSPDDLKVLRNLGVQLVPIELPRQLPAQALQIILTVEASAAFDEITRAGTVDQIGSFWPPIFRSNRLVPAVEYLRALRARTLLMRDMAKLFKSIDLYVGVSDLSITNLTGHPCVVIPNGFVKSDHDIETPTALTFTGKLFGESELLAVAKAYQEITGHHLKYPDLNKALRDHAKES